MPTHETVAPGLREFASFLDTHPDVLETRRFPDNTLHLSFIVRTADEVVRIAGLLDADVTTAELREDVHTGTIAVFGGVDVAFVAIEPAPHVLRRDTAATPALVRSDA